MDITPENYVTLTSLDILNATLYADEMQRLKYIYRFRQRFPNIFINYEIRPASNEDYYVPPKLAQRAIKVNLQFSKKGCDSINCYPFTEVGPIDPDTPFGVTQTSETPVFYAQPACYHMDREAAKKSDNENDIQSMEVAYANNKCILVNTIAKVYLNCPYTRTEDHLISGVDDVPGFNVHRDDPLFPESYRGTFNAAYCRRFGRDLINDGCSVQWWESLIGFILGDTIYITFKLLVNNIFSELRDFDYRRPSPILPIPPTVTPQAVLEAWRNARDSKADIVRESTFESFETIQDLGFNINTKLVFESEVGYREVSLTNKITRIYRQYDATKLNQSNNRITNDMSVEDFISQFLEDHSLIGSILTDLGLSYLNNSIKKLFKEINKTLIPAIKRLFTTTSRRVTTRVLAETYKASMVKAVRTIAFKTVSAIAKIITRTAILASTVVGWIIILLTIGDLVLAIWDPFGYSNMFPRGFPNDLSHSYLIAFFESLGESRESFEYLPEYLIEFVETDDELSFESFLDILDYVESLEVNSNGQMLQLFDSPEVDDIDEPTLMATVLASGGLYTLEDFNNYTEKFNETLISKEPDNDNVIGFLLILLAIGSLKYYPDKYIIVFIFFVLALLMYMNQSILFFLRINKYANSVQNNWWEQVFPMKYNIDTNAQT